MTWNLGARASDATIVTASAMPRGGLFYVGETLAFPLTGGNPASWAVRNQYGTVVASGGALTLPTTLTLSPLPPGAYKLYLTRSISDATYGMAAGEQLFAVIRNTAGFPARPGSPFQDNGFDGGGPDIAFHGLILGGPYRHKIDDAANPTVGTSNLAQVQANVAIENSYYIPFDTARPKPQLLAFPAGTLTATNANIATVVNALGTNFYYEGRNEPDANTGYAAFATEEADFYAKVKAANASAKVLGPGMISPVVGGANWLDGFLAAGGGSSIDAISWHDYNAINGDLVIGRQVYDRWVGVLTKYGIQAMPRFMTEWGCFGSTYGSYTPRRQARWLAMSLLMWEQYSIPKEHINFHYYAANDWGFPSFLNVWDFALPSAVMFRVWSEELYGKTHAARLDFGTVENKHYIGSRFTSASDGTSVVAVLSDGRSGSSVTMQVAGATGTLTTVDAYGNTGTVTVTGGLVTLPVSEMQTYLRLPSGATATPVQVIYGRNLTQDVSRAAASKSSGTGSPANVTSGVDEDAYDLNNGLFIDDTVTLPVTLELDLFATTSFDTVIVRCPPPWQHQSSLLDYDVQYWNGSAWVTLDTVTEPTTDFAWVSAQQAGACYYDSYWSGRHIFVHTFTEVRSNKVRLNVRGVSYGGETPLVGPTGNGQGNTTATLAIREIEVYNRRLATHAQYLATIG